MTQNSLLMLFLGEGKSSVIVPFVAAAIANRSRVARVVVLKPLLKQTIDILQRRLGGLVDRRLCMVPFSRKPKMTVNEVDRIETLYAKCMSEGNVLIALPEHIQSFKLQGVDRLLAQDTQVAKALLRTQNYVEESCRDVFDESDELLDPKLQLVYSMGTQRMMDGQPHRWLDMQTIFGFIQQAASEVAALYPQELEYTNRTPSTFPSIRLLTSNAAVVLLNRVRHWVFENLLPGLKDTNVSAAVKAAAQAYIQDSNIDRESYNILFEYFQDDGSMQQKLHHFRGLFACGIVLHVLQDKRWTVNYGLHTNRRMLAVPYMRKGVPAHNAEFGHPDVAISFTCLSYYYAGLNYIQFRNVIKRLSEDDDPSLEYSLWIQHHDPRYNIPEHFAAVNLDDDHQCREQLFPAIRYNKRLIDYHLVHLVFPKEGREFDHKISTSAWDLAADTHRHCKTGFSGTNDNQAALPLSIKQRDIASTKHTSALALHSVLRKENRRYISLAQRPGHQLTSVDVLKCVMSEDPSIRVLIDVGAQILDLTNLDFVREWLILDENLKAGIFFDNDGTQMVVSRDEKVEKLANSYFRTQLSDCVAYFDEQSTRGTDLQLPIDARAILLRRGSEGVSYLLSGEACR